MNALGQNVFGINGQVYVCGDFDRFNGQSPGKLVRLNALACTTSAHDLPLGRIRDTPELRAELEACVAEGAAVAVAELDAPTASIASLNRAMKSPRS